MSSTVDKGARTDSPHGHLADDPHTMPPGSDVHTILLEENQALEEALRLSRRRLAGMRDVAAALAGRLDLDELLRTIIGKVGELLDCDRATLFVIDEERRELWSRVIEGSATIRLPLGSGVAGYVAATGQPLNLLDAYEDPRFDQRFDAASGYRTRSLLAAPILSTDGRVMGVVEALNKRVGPFGIEDERMLEAITGQISVALKNAFLFEELKDKAGRLERAQTTLQRRVDELDLLASLEQAMATATSESELLDVVVRRVRAILGADAASIALVEPKLTALRFHAATGVGEEKTVGTSMPLDTGLVGNAVQNDVAVRVDDASADPRHAQRVAKELGLMPGPLMAVPLAVPALGGDRRESPRDGDQQPYGAIMALRDKGKAPFAAEDERLLHLVAHRVAGALHEARRRERTKNAEQLERLGTMLAGIVHDLKTPMTVISGYVQLMAMEDDATERQQNADVVLKNCDQMTSMMKELLQFVRGDSTILIRKVYVQGFLKEVDDMLRRLVAARPHITVATRTGYRGAVRIDDLKMKRALANLAKNAIEALGDVPGTVELAVEQVGDQVEFAVSDTGPGLPAEIEGRLFEQFATHGKKEGTGLGLALVKKIVEDHNGDVRVESKKGQGVTFRLRVPL